MDRINFNEIFRLNEDGSVETLRTVRIGGVKMGPRVKLGRGILFGGMSLHNLVGRDFQASEENGVLAIKAVYEQ